jgi:hypothetical protein
LAEQLAWAYSISSGPAKSRVPPQWEDAFTLAAALAAGAQEIGRRRRLAHAVVGRAQARSIQDVRER